MEKAWKNRKEVHPLTGLHLFLYFVKSIDYIYVI